jgi:hypothetical protein
MRPLAPSPVRPRALAGRAALAALLSLAACEDNQTHPEQHGAYEAGAAAPLSCVPNLDGRIDASELAPVLDSPVQYLVSPSGVSRTVDLAGTTDASGHLVWDFGTDYADDQVATIQATALAGQWYAATFPGGQFVTPFDAGDTLEAVYSQDGNGLYIHGIASTQQSPAEGQTLYAYGTPVTLYVFPLTAGATWTTTGVVQPGGMLRGLPYAGKDTYDGADVAVGQLLLPAFTFQQAHRVRFVVTAAPAAGQNVVLRQDSFLFECFGEIARATSHPGETSDDFTSAAEVRRFGPQQ